MTENLDWLVFQMTLDDISLGVLLDKRSVGEFPTREGLLRWQLSHTKVKASWFQLISDPSDSLQIYPAPCRPAPTQVMSPASGLLA